MQRPADGSVQWLIPRRRWIAPAHGRAARPRSCPLSARQRARTAAAPSLTSSSPRRLTRKAPAPLRSALAPGSCHPHLPHERVLRIAPVPEGARSRLAGLAWSGAYPWGLGTPRPLPGRSGMSFDWSFTAGLCAAGALRASPPAKTPGCLPDPGGRAPRCAPWQPPSGCRLLRRFFLLEGDAR